MFLSVNTANTWEEHATNIEILRRIRTATKLFLTEGDS